MSRRHERALKRLERIHHRRLLEQGERIRECLARDGCKETDCMYFALPENFEELISFACDVLAEEFGTLENKSENACAFAKEADPETDPEPAAEADPEFASGTKQDAAAKPVQPAEMETDPVPETVVFGGKKYERYEWYSVANPEQRFYAFQEKQ